VNRTTDGQITTQPATEPAPSPTTTPAPTTTTEQPKPDAKPGETLLTEKKTEAAPQGAPEKYTDYTVPEGFTLDADVKTEADKIFKGMNLSQTQAQELVNFYTAKTREAFEAPFNAYQETRKEWRTAAENDQDLRGKLSPGGDVLTTVARALESLNDPKLASDFREAMDMTGVGDHPAFIKTFYRLAQRLTEGTHVAGRGPVPAGQAKPGTEAQSPAQTLWPNLPSTARG
jgi:antitoxin component of RelBE/YafQ-DinJ toxin-antitoxin module